MIFVAEFIAGILITTPTSSEYYLVTISVDLDFSIFEKPHFWRASFLINTMYFFYVTYI